MKQNKIALKTLGIKARVYNHIRKVLYKKRWEDIKTNERDQILKEIFDLNHQAHWELLNYKAKRQNKKALLEKRLASAQTKSMMKKLKKFQINLVNSLKQCIFV